MSDYTRLHVCMYVMQMCVAFNLCLLVYLPVHVRLYTLACVHVCDADVCGFQLSVLACVCTRLHVCGSSETKDSISCNYIKPLSPGISNANKCKHKFCMVAIHLRPCNQASEVQMQKRRVNHRHRDDRGNAENADNADSLYQYSCTVSGTTGDLFCWHLHIIIISVVSASQAPELP